MAPQMRNDEPSPILTSVFTALALIGSVIGLAKVPGLGIGWSNVFVPLGGIGLISIHWKALAPILGKYRTLFILTVALGLWGLVAAVAGWDPGLSFRWLVKAGGWTLVFVGATAACRDEDHTRALLRTLWLFLIVLALGGIMESVLPKHALWRFFRTEDSLSIQPRVASFLGWPNQFGLIMAGGLFLNESLGVAGILNRWAVALARVVLITQMAQSGSRNAYLTFAVVLVVAVTARGVTWKQALAAAAVFAIAVVLLPVAALQAGLGKVYVPQLEPSLEGRTWELSARKQTLSLRSQLWRQAATEIAANPLTGIGPNVFQNSVGPRVMDRTGFNAHNLPLQIAVETGVIGLALALAWAVTLAFRRTRHSPAALPLAVLAVGQMLDCFVHDPPTMVIGALLCGALLGEWPQPGKTVPILETDGAKKCRS
ncbi:MAG: hypothetical protein DRJ61_19325 [Acidobacteria bacterium]|nr:MAG: hypothetical protein DRJ65_11290 [Acidobacteriota bacterium]RLE25271.1 MAG: hypothetical protein DRJ61_19325 [Acidobacteriota bacterium]